MPVLPPRRLLASLLLVSSLAVTLAGCSNQCAQLKEQYAEALAAERPFTSAEDQPNGGELPIHLGVAMRMSVLNHVVDQALHAGLGEALDVTDELRIASDDTVSVKTEGEVADLELFAEPGCENCVRLEGKLDGKVGVKLPVLGVQRVPLRGTFRLVAPLIFERAEEGGGTVLLDLSRVVELNRSRVDAQFARLPPTWASALASPLSKRLLEAVATKLGPLPLFSYDGPDLGLDGLEIVPARLVTDARRRVLYVGFSTNLAPSGDDPASLIPRTDLLGKDDSVALAVHPALVVPALQAMMRSEDLSRSYDDEGRPTKGGAFQVTVDHVRLGPSEAGGASPLSVAFRAWKVGAEDGCYWADARAEGALSLSDGELRMEVKDVELVDASMSKVVVDLARWTGASFLETSGTILRRAVAPEAVELPGGAWQMKSPSLAVDANGIVVRGRIELSEAP